MGNREGFEFISYQYHICTQVNCKDSILFASPFGILHDNLENQKENILTIKSVTTISYVPSIFLCIIQLQFTIHLNLYFAP